MDRRKRCDGFDLDDHCVFDHEIEPVIRVKNDSFVNDRQLSLRHKTQPAG